jgi:two-component system, OmpR family, sensor histidine kinase ArlS
MPIRLRIIFLFAVLVVIILGVVCTGVYYFSYTARVNTIKTRLTNRAITTARLLAQKEVFDQQLVRRIDSLTTMALKNKTVQAYDYQNNKIYSYSEMPGDSLMIDEVLLDEARINQSYYFTVGAKEVVAYHYTDDNARLVVVTAAEDVDGRQNMKRLRDILLLSFFIGIALIIVFGYLFSARLLRPVKRITDEVREISAQNLARQITGWKPKDEWYQLTKTLNELLNRLKESFDLQRRFISNASHELSTPLTSVSSQLEVSLQRDRSAGEYRKVMESVHQDVQHMSRLVQVLLEFAKASGDAGGLEINRIRIDEIIMRLSSEIPKLDPAYSIRIQFGKLPESEEDLLVLGNETLLFSAIKNIVENACKYSREKKAVVLFETREKMIVISVLDQGKGIPENEIQKIFQPFYRVEENIASEGFGLGLALADKIIKLHNGRIEIESNAGTGTKFTILLPSSGNLG